MRRAALYAVILAGVAALSYGLGRRQAGTKEGQPRPPAVSATAQSRTGSDKQKSGSLPPQQPTSENPELKSPYAQSLASTVKGWEAARLDVAKALKRFASLPISERRGFIAGVFAFLGRNYAPAEALRIYGQQADAVRPDALRALGAEWVSNRGTPGGENQQSLREQVLASSAGRFGLEVQLAYSLAASRPDPELIRAWLGAFAQSPARSEMLSAFAGDLLRQGPDSVLTQTEGWTEWERERVGRRLLESWAQNKPEDAWAWYQSAQNRFGHDLSASVLDEWARSDPESVKTLLSSLENPAQHQAAVAALGTALAQKNTLEAVAWADALPEAADREIAHRSIYQATPRGIGAAISSENGFPTLRAIVPGSPLEGTGVQPGDQFVEVRQGDGTSQSLVGMDLSSVVNLLRGEAGTEIQIRLLRKNSDSGQLEEYVVPLKRAQLYLNNSGSGKKQ